jgi:DNA-binding LacI/PurR family transcriptional regulator
MTDRKTRVTSIDVARHAGVSQSAVSRALAPGARGVSPQLRQRVLASAAALGYRPNAHARSLISGRSRIVALLFSYLDNPFYALLLEQLCAGLQAEGYHALYFLKPDTTENVGRTVSELLDYRVDGIITASVVLGSDIAEECALFGIPLVMVNREGPDQRHSAVTVDNVAGGRLAARHLMSIERRRIALLAGWEAASTNRDREFGFKAELASAGVPLFARDVGQFQLVETEKATRRLFSGTSEIPDALFVMNDYMAFRVMSALRYELGLRIPEDVAVIGFDDVPLAQAPEYDLTTVRQPIGRIVTHAIRIMLAGISRAETERIALAPELILRGSTGGPPSALMM